MKDIDILSQILYNNKLKIEKNNCIINSNEKDFQAQKTYREPMPRTESMGGENLKQHLGAGICKECPVIPALGNVHCQVRVPVMR